MSDNINGTWKKNLQNFLKGTGKITVDSFRNKSIIVPLQGGQTQVVDSSNVDEFLKSHKLQPNFYYTFNVFKNSNGGIKTTAKEANSENANLLVVSPQQSQKTRSRMFDIQGMYVCYMTDKSNFNAKIKGIRNYLICNPTSKNLLKLAIADKLASVCPLIYVQMFLTNQCEESDTICKEMDNVQLQNANCQLTQEQMNQQMQLLTDFISNISTMDPKMKCDELEQCLEINHNSAANLIDNITSVGDTKHGFMFSIMLLQEQNNIIVQACGDQCAKVCDIFARLLVDCVRK